LKELDRCSDVCRDVVSGVVAVLSATADADKPVNVLVDGTAVMFAMNDGRVVLIGKMSVDTFERALEDTTVDVTATILAGTVDVIDDGPNDSDDAGVAGAAGNENCLLIVAVCGANDDDVIVAAVTAAAAAAGAVAVATN